MIPRTLQLVAVLSAGGFLALAGCGTSDPPPPARIILYPMFPYVYQGLTSRMVDSVLDFDGHVIIGANVRYASLDPSIIAASTGGTLRSVGDTGMARIKASYDGIDTVVSVPVVERVGTVDVDPDSLVIPLGVQGTLQVFFLSVSGGLYRVPMMASCSSDNSRIVRVVDADCGGIFGGIQTGRAHITVRVDTIKVVVPVRVTSP